jgi:hypothetical protein
METGKKMRYRIVNGLTIFHPFSWVLFSTGNIPFLILFMGRRFSAQLLLFLQGPIKRD